MENKLRQHRTEKVSNLKVKNLDHMAENSEIERELRKFRGYDIPTRTQNSQSKNTVMDHLRLRVLDEVNTEKRNKQIDSIDKEIFRLLGRKG